MQFPSHGNQNPSGGVEIAVVGRPRAESRLVEAAKQGDARAYEELLRLHEDVAFRTAYLITGSAAEAEEAAQDAFVKAHRALRRFRRDAPFRPWLLRIVANEARNRRRSAGRRVGLLARAAAAEVSGDAAPSPETQVVAGEDRERLIAAVGRLREEERVAIVGRYFLGLTDEETAAALGVRRGTVKTRVWRALERLRAELEAEGR
jgi:RNA polymerase sigma-70 factor (ECF subfamily)